jgi:hypothetical protein
MIVTMPAGVIFNSARGKSKWQDLGLGRVKPRDRKRVRAVYDPLRGATAPSVISLQWSLKFRLPPKKEAEAI